MNQKILTDLLRLEEEGTPTNQEVKLETAITGIINSSLCKLCFKAPSLDLCRWQKTGLCTPAEHEQIWRAGCGESKYSSRSLQYRMHSRPGVGGLPGRPPSGSTIGGLLFITAHCERRFSFIHNQALRKLCAIFLLNLLAMNISRFNRGHLIATLKLPNSFNIHSVLREEDLREKL